MSDQERISPNYIRRTSSAQVMRTKINIIIRWSDTKFSELTSKEFYGRQYGELLVRSRERKGWAILKLESNKQKRYKSVDR